MGQAEDTVAHGGPTRIERVAHGDDFPRGVPARQPSAGAETLSADPKALADKYFPPRCAEEGWARGLLAPLHPIGRLDAEESEPEGKNAGGEVGQVKARGALFGRSRLEDGARLVERGERGGEPVKIRAEPVRLERVGDLVDRGAEAEDLEAKGALFGGEQADHALFGGVSVPPAKIDRMRAWAYCK